SPLLAGCRFPQGEERFVLRAKSFCELSREWKIVRRRTGAKIEHDRIRFLGGKISQIRIERVEVGFGQCAKPEIIDVAIQHLSVKRRGRFRGISIGVRKKNHAAPEPGKNSFEGGAA